MNVELLHETIASLRLCLHVGYFIDSFPIHILSLVSLLLNINILDLRR